MRTRRGRQEFGHNVRNVILIAILIPGVLLTACSTDNGKDAVPTTEGIETSTPPESTAPVEDIVMPDVVNVRLDIAKSDIEHTGFKGEIEVLSDGTFGVVQESNWTVCEQTPAAGDLITEPPRLIVERDCSTQTDAAVTEGSVGEEPAGKAADATPDPTTEPAPAAAPVEAAPTASMPNVVCMNLQDAQNRIQEAGVFYSQSHDATGQGRRQVMDRNWVVVSQSPSPGTLIGEGDVDLGAVKYGEPSPC